MGSAINNIHSINVHRNGLNRQLNQRFAFFFFFFTALQPAPETTDKLIVPCNPSHERTTSVERLSISGQPENNLRVSRQRGAALRPIFPADDERYMKIWALICPAAAMYDTAIIRNTPT